MKLTSDTDLMNVASKISGQIVKGQGHRGHSKFLSCPPHDSVPISPICFIIGTNIVHDVSVCRHPFPDQKVKGRRSF